MDVATCHIHALPLARHGKGFVKKKEENFYIFIFQNLLFFKKLVSFSYPNPLACRVTVI